MPDAVRSKVPELPPFKPCTNVTSHWGRQRDDELQYLQHDIKTLNGYISRENVAARSFFGQRRRVIRSLRRELESFLRVQDVPPPVSDVAEGWEYWTDSSEYGPVHWRRRMFAPNAEAQLVMHPRSLRGRDLRKLTMSLSHRYVGYVAERPGDEYGTLFVHEIGSNSPPVAVAKGERVFSFEFFDDHTVVYTAVSNEQLRPSQVCLGKWADSAERHRVIFEDGKSFIDLGKTKDKQFITINCNTLDSSEVHILNVEDPTASPKLIAPREDNVQYYVDHHDSQFFILTNADGAQDCKLVSAPSTKPGREFWQDLYVPQQGDKIEDVDMFADYLVIYLKRAGQSVVQVLDLRKGEGDSLVERYHEVILATGSSVRPGVNMDYCASRSRMTIHHPFSHDSVYEYDMENRQMTPKKIVDIPKHAFDRCRFDVTRVWVNSRDSKTRIPVTLLHRKGLVRNQSNPVSIRAYGAYGLCLEPEIKVENLALLNRGWVIALAHVRGGSEMGKLWHEEGRRMHKLNTFNDVIDVVEHLCSSGITQPSLVTATGVSAGAMAIASSALQRPDLFRALVLHSPFVDVLSCMLDESLPLTQSEFLEWGNPLTSPEVYDLLDRYSPVEILRRRVARDTDGSSTAEGPSSERFPALLVTAGMRDQRTPVWQTAKFVALYRRAAAIAGGSGAKGPILWTSSESAGHFGISGEGQTERLEDGAEELVFLLSQVSAPDCGHDPPAATRHRPSSLTARLVSALTG